MSDNEFKIKRSNMDILNYIVSYYKPFVGKLYYYDKGAYFNNLKLVSKLLASVNFNKNILFLCPNDISKEVFFEGLIRLNSMRKGGSKLPSYYQCNILDIMDIWWGNNKNSPKIDEVDKIYSEQEIQEDVFCLYCDPSMRSMQGDKFVNSIIVSRDGRLTKYGNSMRSWVFYKGTSDDMASRDGFSEIYKLFKDKTSREKPEYDPEYIIIDVQSTTRTKDLSKKIYEGMIRGVEKCLRDQHLKSGGKVKSDFSTENLAEAQVIKKEYKKSYGDNTSAGAESNNEPTVSKKSGTVRENTAEVNNYIY